MILSKLSARILYDVGYVSCTCKKCRITIEYDIHKTHPPHTHIYTHTACMSKKTNALTPTTDTQTRTHTHTHSHKHTHMCAWTRTHVLASCIHC